MTDPERLSLRSKGLAAELLRAASDEQPSERGMQQTLLALGVSGVMLSTTSAAAAAGTQLASAASTTAAASGVGLASGGAVSTVSAVLIAKWVGIGVLGGFSVLGAAAVATRPPPRTAVVHAPVAVPQAARSAASIATSVRSELQPAVVASAAPVIAPSATQPRAIAVEPRAAEPAADEPARWASAQAASRITLRVGCVPVITSRFERISFHEDLGLCRAVQFGVAWRVWWRVEHRRRCRRGTGSRFGRLERNERSQSRRLTGDGPAQRRLRQRDSNGPRRHQLRGKHWNANPRGWSWLDGDRRRVVDPRMQDRRGLPGRRWLRGLPQRQDGVPARLLPDGVLSQRGARLRQHQQSLRGRTVWHRVHAVRDGR